MKDQLANPYIFLKSRRSIRKFSEKNISQDMLQRILEAACAAPSAHNRQPWRFILIAEQDVKRKLAEQMGKRLAEDRRADGDAESEIRLDVQQSQDRILKAPLVVLVCLTMEDMDRYPDQRRMRAEYQMAVQSVAMASQNLLLAAHGEGLGGCWMCAPLFAQAEVKTLFTLPEAWEPQGMILLGYPAEEGQAKARRPLDEIVAIATEEAPLLKPMETKPHDG